jgi:hypothetical protein
LSKLSQLIIIKGLIAADKSKAFYYYSFSD